VSRSLETSLTTTSKGRALRQNSTTREAMDKRMAPRDSSRRPQHEHLLRPQGNNHRSAFPPLLKSFLFPSPLFSFSFLTKNSLDEHWSMSSSTSSRYQHIINLANSRICNSHTTPQPINAHHNQPCRAEERERITLKGMTGPAIHSRPAFRSPTTLSYQ